MLFNTQHKRTLLFTAISTMSLLPLSGMTLAQDDAQIEEVVVTGSFIRRSEGFDQASSVLQFTAEDLENQGTLNLGEVIQQLSFVNGSASAITTMAAQGGSSRTTSIDLRGLGARSTLTLLDGKRLVSQNVNALIPTIALQRMDIVADGAAALYGSEAVAGVVNFVPYKSYDGLKLETFAEGDSEGDWDQHSAQLMWGRRCRRNRRGRGWPVSASRVAWGGTSATCWPTLAIIYPPMARVTGACRSVMRAGYTLGSM